MSELDWAWMGSFGVVRSSRPLVNSRKGVRLATVTPHHVRVCSLRNTLLQVA